VAAYLEAGRPADALTWLQDSWEQFETRRQSLLSGTLARLGRSQESVELRQQMFEKSLAVSDYQRWLELLTPPARPPASARTGAATGAGACRSVRRCTDAAGPG